MKTTRSTNPSIWILVALAVATLLKTLWATSSIGTVDVLLYRSFAHGIDEIGLAKFYETVPRWNQTPITSYMVVALERLSNGSLPAFAFGFRSLSIVADILLTLGLLRLRAVANFPSWKAVALVTLSPVAIMVSGFHGNIDPIMTVALFYAVLACVEERPIVAGVLYGVACSIKIVPLVLAPAFFFWWMQRRNEWRFAIPAAGVFLLSCSVPLVHSPQAFVKGVIAYSSYWGTWGITLFVKMTGHESLQKVDFLGLTPLQNIIVSIIKLIAISLVCFISWRRRKASAEGLFLTIAGIFAIVYSFAPGIGVQYMVWIAPFLAVASGTWFVAVTAVATLFLVVFYHTTASSGFPWVLAIPESQHLPVWGPWGIPCWAVFVAFLVCNGSKLIDAQVSTLNRREPKDMATSSSSSTSQEAALVT